MKRLDAIAAFVAQAKPVEEDGKVLVRLVPATFLAAEGEWLLERVRELEAVVRETNRIALGEDFCWHCGGHPVRDGHENDCLITVALENLEADE